MAREDAPLAATRAATFTVGAVQEREAVTDHDVIAFLTAWADNTEPRSAAAWVHYGMTSSDLLDTALAVQLAEASDLLIAKALALDPNSAWTWIRSGYLHAYRGEPETALAHFERAARHAHEHADGILRRAGRRTGRMIS